jgi:uncharacterized protein YyaL (SSP411 family)
MNHEKESKVQRKPNRLINDKSPYLQQHAYNPVDWFPWGEEAFEKAREENKPIFLSIGYSTCHWCHVMEKEVFEDPVAATFMNEVFVSIKVDREERPDLDNIYMAASQMLTGSGGWPLNIIMTPDKRPFFAATYIPREGRGGHIGMLELVPRIKEAWRTRNEDVMKSAERITAALAQVSPGAPGEELGEETLKVAYNELSQRFDHNALTRSTEVSATCPNSPPRTIFCSCSVTGKKQGTPRPLRWLRRPSGPCASAVSTTTSGSVSTVIQRAVNGSCRTLKRCSTTRP